MSTQTVLLLLGGAYLFLAYHRPTPRLLPPQGRTIGQGSASGWSVAIPGLFNIASGPGGWSVALPPDPSPIPPPAIPDASNESWYPGGTWGDALGGPMPDPAIPDVWQASTPTVDLVPPDSEWLGNLG